MALAKRRNPQPEVVHFSVPKTVGLITTERPIGVIHQVATAATETLPPTPERTIRPAFNRPPTVNRASSSFPFSSPHLSPSSRVDSSAATSATSASSGGGVLLRTQVAKNLILARNSLGVTQDSLAESSGVSRATIAQIESGDNDCRLSTLSDLADALTISPVLLLLRSSDISSLIRFLPHSAVERILSKLTTSQIQEMHTQLQSGLQKNLVRVAQTGAAAAQAAGFTTRGAAVGAGIGSAVTPGIGTAIGTIFGQVLSDHPAQRTLELEGGAGI